MKDAQDDTLAIIASLLALVFFMMIMFSEECEAEASAEIQFIPLENEVFTELYAPDLPYRTTYITSDRDLYVVLFTTDYGDQFHLLSKPQGYPLFDRTPVLEAARPISILIQEVVD